MRQSVWVHPCCDCQMVICTCGTPCSALSLSAGISVLCIEEQAAVSLVTSIGYIMDADSLTAIYDRL